MTDASIRVKEETYKTIIKARGAFEQTFGRKLTLDESMFLAASYVNIAYEEFQKLMTADLVNLVVEKDGTFQVKWVDLEKILLAVLPRLMSAFANLKGILEEKEEKVSPSAITAEEG